MNFFNTLFGGSETIDASQAHRIATSQSSIMKNQTYQKCMQDIRLSASVGDFETRCHTRDPEIINGLKKQGFRVECDTYSKYDYNYGFPERIAHNGIKVSWKEQSDDNVNILNDIEKAKNKTQSLVNNYDCK